jgi:hypothetical protein
VRRQIGWGLLIANHLDQLLWCFSDQKPLRNEQSVRSYLLHSFLQVHTVAEPLTSDRKLCNYAEPKPFPISVRQSDIFWVFFIPVYWAGSHAKHSWRCRPLQWALRELAVWRCGVGYGNVDLATYSKGNLGKWMWT